ncbi:hypothetical protein [Aquibacillus kalidii]|uniref:hypothetical protein n=1 Tax=Aquibacillus kalidii TaxID=2762597 RepID=UPI001645C0F6|nr:hypothetical protein [Aquibacillus kalidii]
MAKRKKKKPNTPRHKRMNRTRRLEAAPHWIPKYTRNNLVKGYSNHFAVDHLCAMYELEHLGYQFSDEYKQQLKRNLINKQRATEIKKERKAEKRRREQEELYEESDENFTFIAGYTEGGFPFGITWEESDETEPSKDNNGREEKKDWNFTDDSDLPF